jgi:hypothetical protein
VLFPAELRAQAVSGGLGLPVHVPDIPAYQSSYVPTFLFGTQSDGRATQSITLDRTARPSLWGAFDWFPSPHAGIILRGGFRRSPLDGTNAPYHVAIDYLARQPPDFVERQYHYDRSTAWPDTMGHLDTWSFDAQASIATRANAAWRVHIDGGLSIIGLSGSFEPVGLTTFQLGGHSVVFTNEYQLELGSSRTWTAAFVASGGLTIPLGSRAGLDISGRAVMPRTVSVDLKVLSVGGDTAIATLSVEEAQRALSPAPMAIKLGTVELLVGLRVGL